jgi:transcriptional regulator
MLHVELLQERLPLQTKLDILQGTLDLMVLRTLSVMGPLHGYGIARRIEQVSGDTVILNQGTIYTSLVRLEQRGWIRSKWGVSENNRRARFYAITRTGEKQLVAETETWQRVAAVMGRVLAGGGPDR